MVVVDKQMHVRSFISSVYHYFDTLLLQLVTRKQ